MTTGVEKRFPFLDFSSANQNCALACVLGRSQTLICLRFETACGSVFVQGNHPNIVFFWYTHVSLSRTGPRNPSKGP